MGSGTWSTDTYSARASARAATGTSAFTYTETAQDIHPTLDPRGAYRESRDSDEHPESLAIAVLFDVTGSMLQTPQELQKRLPALLDLLLLKGYTEHPQIMFGATADYLDKGRRVLQVGQFESDIRMEDHLTNLLLGGGGGSPSRHEAYELAMYFMARHVATDCWDKRGIKPFLFMFGDEFANPMLTPERVKSFIGDDITDPIPLVDLAAELRDKYNVYFIVLKTGTSYGDDPKLHDFWRVLFGENVLIIDNVEAVCETIGLVVGIETGSIDLTVGLKDLEDRDTPSAIVQSVQRSFSSRAGAVLPTGPKVERL